MSRKNTIILLPVLLMFAAFLYWQFHQRTFADRGDLSVSREGDSVVLSWQGEIEVPMARKFRAAFRKWSDKTGKFVIDLNSPGGALREGNRVIRQIEEMKRTHVIETHVGHNKFCLSMCVPIFLTGDDRVAAASSRWMFHQPIAEDIFSGEQINVPSSEREYFGNRFFERYFDQSEMNPIWRENLRREWIGRDVWRTGKQLVDEQSNIIEELY